MPIVRWISIGFEAAFGTAVAGKYFIDPTRVTLDSPNSPFLFYPGASGRGNRQITPAGYMPVGDIEVALDQYRTGALIRGVIPRVNYQQNGISKGGASTTVDTAGVAVGATVIPVAASAGFAADDIIQVGADLGPSELHKVVSVAVGPDTITIDDALGMTFAHAVGVVVDELDTLQYLHTFDFGGTTTALDAMTIRLAKDTDEQVFHGASVNQLRLTASHNSLVSLVASIVASTESVAVVPGAPTPGIMSPPYASVHLDLADLDDLVAGSDDILPVIRSMEFIANNNVAVEDGMRMGTRFPVEFRGLALDITFTTTVVFRDRKQSEDFWGAAAPTEGVVVGRNIKLRYAQDVENIVEVEANNAYPVSVPSPISGRDQLTQTVEWRSIQPASADMLARVTMRNQTEFRYY